MHPIGLQNYYTSPFYDDLSFLSSQLSKSWYLLLFSFMYIYIYIVFLNSTIQYMSSWKVFH